MDVNIKELENDISLFLKNCSSILIFGIGNDIRGDDGLGPYIINRLSNLKENLLNNNMFDDVDIGVLDTIDNYNNVNSCDDRNLHNFDLNNLYLINGGSVPENFTGLIKKYNPSHIIFVDATLMNKEAGEISIVQKENIVDLSISTHSMSLAYLIKYLELEKDFEIMFIGIQPKFMDLSFELSDEIKTASDTLIKVLFSVITDL